MFRRRPVPSVPSEPGPWPDKREKTLWNNWLAEPPYTVSRTYTETYKSFYEEMFWYTPKEEWYWSEELHTASDNGVWREWTDDKGKKGEEKVDEGIEDKRGEKRRRESTGLEGITLA